MVACGLTFMGLGILAAVFYLPSEYVMALRRKKLFHFAILTFLSCAILIAFGEIPAISWIILWLLGGFMGSFASVEFGVRLRYAY